MNSQILTGDCLTVMRTMETESVDAIVCDPPAGIAFMGKSWDHDKGGRDAWIAWLAEVMREGLRLLKPGGHALVWALPRTSHWTGMALEDAGFEVRDRISHLFGSGFPKSLDVGKAIDKQRDDRADILRVTTFMADAAERRGVTRADVDAHLGTSDMGGWWLSRLAHRCQCPKWDQWLALKALLGFGDEMDAEVWRLNGRKGKPGEAWHEREVVGERNRSGKPPQYMWGETDGQKWDETTAATDLAKQWDGWGTALKPGAEDWWLCRKPLTGTVAGNVALHGTGALNIDGCRIAGAPDPGSWTAKRTIGVNDADGRLGQKRANVEAMNAGLIKPPSGRWPANVVLSHTPECREVGTRKVKGANPPGPGDRGIGYAPATNKTSGIQRYADADGTETVTAWDCVEHCPVRMLDEQSGKLTSGGFPARRFSPKTKNAFGDFADDTDGERFTYGNGGASRFYYCAKASRAEREMGLDGGERKAKLWSSGTQNPGSFQAEGTDRTSTNHHPTVKPLALMRWLCRLVTPPNGLILDPFCGSGSTGCAAALEGFRFVGIEQDPEYCAIAEKRIAHYRKQLSLFDAPE
jgi:hypothetical protein